MAELSLAGSEIGREMLGVILSALASKGQGAIAQVMGISDSSMSRWKSDEIPVMAKFLAALDLKIFPENCIPVEPEIYRALRAFARAEGRRDPLPRAIARERHAGCCACGRRAELPGERAPPERPNIDTPARRWRAPAPLRLRWHRGGDGHEAAMGTRHAR